jgi:hypothetical protein
MSKEKKEKLGYEKPILNHLDEVAYGQQSCAIGSSNTGDTCAVGGQATTTCAGGGQDV